MPSMENHTSQTVVKLLLLGDSSAGKSGLLATLAKDYRLFIADFDQGLDILRDPKVLFPEYRKNVFYQSFYDKTSVFQGKITPTATGFAAFTNAINDWKEDGKSLGNIYTWGPTDVFVIDSLTFLGNAIMNHVLQLAGRSGTKPQLQDFGAAVDSQEAVIETLYNPAVQCNVIVTAHLTMQADEFMGGIKKAMPSALGSKLPPKIARYFNNVILIEKSGHGEKVERKLITTATFSTNLKTSKPSIVPAVMPPDLSKLFSLLRGQ